MAIAFLLSTVAACATMAEQLRTDIAAGRFDEAEKKGEAWLSEHEEKWPSDEVEVVQKLRAEAALGRASSIDTVAAYQAFVKRFTGKTRYGPLLDNARRRETAAFYRDTVLRGRRIEDCRAYRSEYPEGVQLPAVKALEADLAFSDARRMGTTHAFKEFRSQYGTWPEAAGRVAEARMAELERAMLDARSTKSAESYRRIRTEYGQWPEAATRLGDVRSAEVQAAWSEATAAGTEEAFTRFVVEYRSWPEATALLASARRALVDVAFRGAVGNSSLERLRAFRVAYADWPEAAAQVDQVAQIEATLVWNVIQKTTDWNKFQQFVVEYPRSPYAAEAARRARGLWGSLARSGVEEFQTELSSIDVSNPDRAVAYVQVFDSAGNPVGGLGRQQFEVFEGGCQAEQMEFLGMESPRPTDVVFLLDTTGSMDPYIEGAKASAVEFAEGLRLRNRDLRLGLVVFGDEVRGVYPASGPLTANIEAFKGWVSRQTAGGGGDTPENPLGALVAAAGMAFRRDAQVVFILVTDAPPHENDAVTRLDARRTARHLIGKKVSLFTVAPRVGSYEILARTLGGRLYPIRAHSRFSDLLVEIGTLTAKQYRVVFRSTRCTFAAAPLRIRAYREHTWTAQSSVPSAEVRCLVPLPGVAEGFLACTHDAGVLATSDGGTTWSKRSSGEPRSAAFEALWVTSADGSRVLGRSTKGLLWMSADGGRTWRRPQGLERPVLDVAQDSGDPSHLFSIDDRCLHESTDGGQTWEDRSELPTGGLTRGRLVASAGERAALWLALPGGRVLVSTDNGSTMAPTRWEQPEPGFDFSEALLGTHAAWKGSLFALGGDGRLWRSGDRGRSWTLSYSPGEAGLGAARRMVFDPTRRHWLLLLCEGGVMTSRDGGATWLRLAKLRGTGEPESPLLALGSGGLALGVEPRGGKVFSLSPVVDREFISGNVYFATGSAAVSTGLHGYLEKLAFHLRRRPDLRLRIEGHTDDVGDHAKNMDLSLMRADSVRSVLVARAIEAGRILIAGYGELRPLFPNTSAANRARNRRVELTLIGRNQRIPAWESASAEREDRN